MLNFSFIVRPTQKLLMSPSKTFSRFDKYFSYQHVLSSIPTPFTHSFPLFFGLIRCRPSQTRQVFQVLLLSTSFSFFSAFFPYQNCLLLDHQSHHLPLFFYVYLSSSYLHINHFSRIIINPLICYELTHSARRTNFTVELFPRNM